MSTVKEKRSAGVDPTVWVGTRGTYVRVLVQRSSGFHEYRPARGRKKEDRQGLGPGVSFQLDSITSNV